MNLNTNYDVMFIFIETVIRKCVRLLIKLVPIDTFFPRY